VLDLDDAQKEQAMLVLSRKLGQRFQVGQDVRVTIVKIDRNSVRIGIEAPDDVTVYREEIAPAEVESSRVTRSTVA
jgi:carbon storage regulator